MHYDPSNVLDSGSRSFLSALESVQGRMYRKCPPVKSAFSSVSLLHLTLMVIRLEEDLIDAVNFKLCIVIGSNYVKNSSISTSL